MPDIRTPAELLYEISRSAYRLVLVEGKTDAKVYRALAKHFTKTKLQFEYCGGRNTLLEVFEKSRSKPNAHLLFLADKDMWVFTGVPSMYEEVFFTNGYSIENDLFADGENWIDGLFSDDEQAQKASLLESLITWFAFEVEKYLQDPTQEMQFAGVHLYSTHVIPKNDTQFTDNFLIDRGFTPPSEEIKQDIAQHYQVKVRGKYLFALLGRLFQERKAADKNAPTFTEEQLWEICLNEGKRNPQGAMQRIIAQIKHFAGEN